MTSDYCSNMYCPQIIALRDGTGPLDIKIHSDKLIDHAGNVWCQECKARHDLMNWAHERKYPSVQCHPYAIGQGDSFWQTACMIGKPEMIEVLTNALLETPQDE